MRTPTAPVSIGLSVGLAIGLFIVSIVALPAGPAVSREPDHTLKLFFGHTGERGEFTFKRNGRYDRRELARINHFLRDWRKNEDAKMDPQLLDLVWAVYHESGSRDYIHVVSAYRSPATNEALRARSSGVAKNSQHRLGKAMDWYLPDVPLAKLRGIAMKMQGGGVGYYPRSGSPFVHTDTGNVRAWPRMTREQLLALFPNGNTLHLPADGKPLPGYETAVARRSSPNSTVLAYLDTEATEADETDRTGTDGNTSGWLKRVFPGDAPEEDDVAATPPPPPPATAEPQMLVASTEDGTDPRMPRARPVDETEISLASLRPTTSDDQGTVATDLAPTPRSRPQSTVFAEEPQDGNAADAIASLAARMDVFGDMPAMPQNSTPVELAFAPANDAPALPTEADRAILSAFSAVDDPGIVREPDATLAAAVAMRASGEQATPQRPAPIVIAAAFAPVAPRTEDATSKDVASSDDTGFILAPDGLAIYEEDEDSLVELIDMPASSDPTQAQLAMPSPESGLYAVPEGAAEVADLQGEAGPPVDRFAPTPVAHDTADQGFFSKLIASLIE